MSTSCLLSLPLTCSSHLVFKIIVCHYKPTQHIYPSLCHRQRSDYTPLSTATSFTPKNSDSHASTPSLHIILARKWLMPMLLLAAHTTTQIALQKQRSDFGSSSWGRTKMTNPKTGGSVPPPYLSLLLPPALSLTSCPLLPSSHRGGITMIRLIQASMPTP